MTDSTFRTTIIAEPFDDRTTRVSWQCSGCAHLNFAEAGLTCAAFPNGIPEDIATEQFDHTQPHAGDNGIQFEEATLAQIDARGI